MLAALQGKTTSPSHVRKAADDENLFILFDAHRFLCTPISTCIYMYMYIYLPEQCQCMKSAISMQLLYIQMYFVLLPA